jgi:uncharacterized protein
VKRVAHFRDAREALSRVYRDGALRDGTERLGPGLPLERPRWGDGTAHQPRDDRVDIASCEQGLPHQRLPQHDPDTEHIGANIHAVAQQLLGRQVVEPLRRARLAAHPVRPNDRNEPTHAVIAQHYVLRLNLAVHEPERAMQDTNAGEHVEQPAKRVRQRQAPGTTKHRFHVSQSLLGCAHRLEAEPNASRSHEREVGTAERRDRTQARYGRERKLFQRHGQYKARPRTIPGPRARSLPCIGVSPSLLFVRRGDVPAWAAAPAAARTRQGRTLRDGIDSSLPSTALIVQRRGGAMVFRSGPASTWAVSEGQITIVREATSHENTGEAGARCALTASVAGPFSRPLAPTTWPKLAKPAAAKQETRPIEPGARRARRSVAFSGRQLADSRGSPKVSAMSAARLLLFVALMTVMLGGINLQVFRWVRNSWQLSRRVTIGIKWVLILAPVGMIAGRLAGRFWPSGGIGTLVAVSSTVELAVVITGILLLAADGVRLLVGLGKSLLMRASGAGARRRPALPATATTSPAAAAAHNAAPAELTRRSFLARATASSALLIGGSSSAYGALKGRYDYSLEEIVVKIPGLPRALEGFSIAQLSDVHIGVYVGDRELNIAKALLRRAKADLIVLTGDLLDNDPRLAPQLGRFVRRLAGLSREGVVAISGNHDYFAGVEDMASAVAAGGGRVLRNQALLLGGASPGLALLGVDDVWARRDGKGPDLDRALSTLPRLGDRVAPARDLPRVLLCHNPSFFAEAAGRVALQLSGHTHGGQVNLGIRPADYLLPGGWVAGRYDLNGSALYVNRGFGTVGPPARVGAPPEVTRIILTA